MSNVLTELRRAINPLEDSLRNPKKYQNELLRELLEGYSGTRYGLEHQAQEIESVEEYRRSFPVLTYERMKPLIERVMEGDYRVLLHEKPLKWVLTRGSTGKPKLLPVTRKHVEEIFKCGSRALIAYILRSGDYELLDGGVLNLNLPSIVGTLRLHGGKEPYGYSSGTYAKLNPKLAGLKLVPKQEEIDKLTAGMTKEDWERRFEAVYERAASEKIIGAIGVAPVQISFARYLKKRHGIYPKDLWRFHAIFSTSVPKIQTRYKPLFEAYYGKTPVIEMYTATEGAFAQQIDEFPYIVPNYDVYFFEVKMGRKFKMLYELKRGEWGRLIVSTSMLPRYDIGDMIECMGKNYFKVFGRAKLSVVIEHILYRALFKWFL